MENDLNMFNMNMWKLMDEILPSTEDKEGEWRVNLANTHHSSLISKVINILFPFQRMLINMAILYIRGLNWRVVQKGKEYFQSILSPSLFLW